MTAMREMAWIASFTAILGAGIWLAPTQGILIAAGSAAGCFWLGIVSGAGLYHVFASGPGSGERKSGAVPDGPAVDQGGGLTSTGTILPSRCTRETPTFEHRTHGGDSAIDDDMPGAQV